jgi:Domain of unknown function (DUF4218)
MHFSPSFFDIMVHLTVHLVREIKMCDLIFLRYMYPFERVMGHLKGLVRSRSRPEGSIVEGYISEEVLEFYIDNLKGVEGVQHIGLPKSRHESRLVEHGTIGFDVVNIDYNLQEQAHLMVLHHMAVVAPYVSEHLSDLREQYPGKGEVSITNKHNKEFTTWFQNTVAIIN